MKKSTLVILLILGILLVAAGLMLGNSGSGAYETLGDFDPSQVASVRAELDSMALSVYKSWDNKVIEVNGSGLAAKYVNVELQGDVLVLTQSEPSGLDRFFYKESYNDCATLWLPRHYPGTLTLSSESGELTLSSVDSNEIKVSLRSGSGDVSAYESELGELSVETGSGDIWISSLDAPKVSLAAGSGDVHIDSGEIGELSIRTGSGHVRADAIEAGSAALTTASGNATVNGAEVSGAGLTVSTNSGDVLISEGEFPELTVQTSSGDIRADGVRADKASFTTSSGDIAGTVEGLNGEPVIETDTVSGEIRLNEP